LDQNFFLEHYTKKNSVFFTQFGKGPLGNKNRVGPEKQGFSGSLWWSEKRSFSEGKENKKRLMFFL